MPVFSINQIAQHVDGQVSGPAELTVTGIEILDKASDTQLSFIRSAKFAEQWGDSKAGVILLSKSIEVPASCKDRSAILVDDADLALNKVIELFAPANQFSRGYLLTLPSPPGELLPALSPCKWKKKNLSSCFYI